MSIRTAISAFVHRGARRGAAIQLLLYGAGLALALLSLASYIAGHAEEPPGGTCGWVGCATLAPLAWSAVELADLLALGVLALGLFVLAPAAIAASAAAERRAGTLDQLRTTPLSPLSLAIGMILGGPFKLYLLLVGPLALHVLCALLGAQPADVLLSSLALLFTGGLASALVGLTVALAPRQESGGVLAGLVVALLLGVAGLIAIAFAGSPDPSGWAFLHPAGALHASLLQHDGLWRRLVVSPWRGDLFREAGYRGRLATSSLFSTVSSLGLSVMLAVACCRKLARPQMALLSKPLALALFASFAGALLAPIRPEIYRYDHTGSLTLGFTLILAPAIALLGLFTTATPEAWSLALRSPRKLRWHEDDAPPHGAMWLMALLAALLLGCALWRDGDARLSSELLPLSVGHRAAALLLAAATVLTLPLYVHFLATRYATSAARWAFGAAIGVHLFCQAIAVAMLYDRASNLEYRFEQLALVAALAVPTVVALGQRALRRRTLGRGTQAG